jgi:hypothetical protein
MIHVTALNCETCELCESDEQNRIDDSCHDATGSDECCHRKL